MTRLVHLQLMFTLLILPLLTPLLLMMCEVLRFLLLISLGGQMCQLRELIDGAVVRPPCFLSTLLVLFFSCFLLHYVFICVSVSATPSTSSERAAGNRRHRLAMREHTALLRAHRLSSHSHGGILRRSASNSRRQGRRPHSDICRQTALLQAG